MRVLLFSDFPAKYIHEKIEPFLQERGVELVAVHPSRQISPQVVQSTEADTVISMVTLMPPSNRGKIKKYALQAGKKYFGVDHKVAGWTESIRGSVPIVRLETVAPTDVKAPREVIESLETVETTPTSLPAETNEILALRAEVARLTDLLDRQRRENDKLIEEALRLTKEPDETHVRLRRSVESTLFLVETGTLDPLVGLETLRRSL